jgi:Domain of unknown function (DUF4124)
MKRQSLVLVLSLCVASAALATTYVRVEKDGTKTYSDRPIPGGQPVELQPAQTYSTPPSAVATDSGLPREQQLLQQADDFRYESCTVSPENNATFQTPETVNISVSTNPPLRPGDVLTMTVDGAPVDGGSYTMSPVNRGSHTVGVNIANTYGTVLCNTTSVFHVQQPGLNSPARQAPPPRPRPPPRPTPH